ncbi:MULTISPECIES: hypothetical protein [unclassified Mesorhizobium]|uniref:hypothetical protein n=1 Tax=unclassified Mesorhizobium TaxID=325217 RepID=UPI0003CFFDA4|nr:MULTISPECIES: hypothetical protein [unclassified Mesorhizobium]ESZ02415.1 hypothetical protein X736_30090 [Mesorhizobium sp. L2C089B000]ESZ38860.1 hypothetical protein X731_28425 [Mesorhizobium sp. L2C054A000]WJI50494.1 hypothetical protein NLY44_28960 [Mesorhizobium sp. C089B]
MSWETRAANNLLPLSWDKGSLSQALREWRYTGDYHDLEAPSANCELCDHPDIRYQFEIRNLHTAARLLIGSECIHRFGIAATDEEGRTLDTLATRKKVDRDRRQLVEDARRRRLVSALVALANVEPNFDVHSFIDYLQTRGAFTPKQLATVLWRLRKKGVVHSPQDFKLTIRRGREKAQLLSLKDWEMALVKPCLTTEQSAYLEKVAHRRSGLDHLLD